MKYFKNLERCDNCGGNGKNCCETPFPITSKLLDIELLTKEGAKVYEKDYQTTIYELQNGRKFEKCAGGWGDREDLSTPIWQKCFKAEIKLLEGKKVYLHKCTVKWQIVGFNFNNFTVNVKRGDKKSDWFNIEDCIL